MNLDRSLQKGRSHHLKGDLRKASELYRKILNINPNHAEANYLFGSLALQSGNARDAAQHLMKAVLNGGEKGPYLSNLAAALLALGLYQKSVEYCDKVDKLGHRTPETATIRAEALCQLGQTEEALRQYEYIYENWPNHIYAIYNYADTLIMMNRFSKAEEVILELVNAKGFDDLLRLKLAAVYRCMDNFEKAEIILNDSLDKNSANWLAGQLKNYIELNRISEAKIIGQKLLEEKDRIAKQNSDYLFNKKTLHNLNMMRMHSDKTRKKDVICFSLWGADQKYTFTSVLNAKLVPEIYPGWVARFYCDESVPIDIVKSLLDYGAEVINVDRDPRPNLSLFWRFMASDDPSIRYFACRDCDAVVNYREKAAVDEWILSGKPFHIMRDHVEHAELIMAGMWGGIAGILPDLSNEAVRYYHNHETKNRWVDQDFLRDRVWHIIKDHALIHDDIYNVGTNTKKFPNGTELPNNQHVGGYLPRTWTPKHN